MPLNKSAAFRFRIIDQCLRNPRKRFPNLIHIQEVVTEALDLPVFISISSLQKDIKAMKLLYNAPIKYCRTERGYYYEEEEFSINSFPLTYNEITALDISVSILKQIKFSGLYHNFESAIEKIISGFRISKIDGFINKKILITEEPSADTGIKWIESMYVAIIMKTALDVHYLKFNASDIKNHILSPYLIREYANRWYVTGHSNLTSGLVTLALDRVIEIKNSYHRYKQPDDFNADEFLNYAFGVTTYQQDDPEKVILLFSESQRGYLESQPIHQSQLIKDVADGFLVEIKCFLTPELEMYVLSLGEKVKVLSPDKLITRIQKRIHAMTYLYNDI